MRSGEAVIVNDITEDALREAFADRPAYLETVLSLDLRATMVVPLVVRDRTLGAITFVSAEKDDVVPPAAAAPAANLVGSRDVEVLRVPAGHVALVTGRTADRVTIPGIIDWLRRHPQ